MAHNPELEQDAPRAKLGDILTFGVPQKISTGGFGYGPVYFDGDYWTKQIGQTHLDLAIGVNLWELVS